jgi:hypothetical protein
VILRNSSGNSDPVEIGFQDEDGQPVALPFDGTQLEKIEHELRPWGTFDIRTDGTGKVQSGVAAVESALGTTSKVEGSEVFGILGAYVSVNSAALRCSHQSYVSVRKSETTALAIFNPYSTITVGAQVTLVNSEGTQVATRRISLLPQQQLVQFVTHETLFSEFFSELEDDFTGTINVNVFDGKNLAVLGLIQKRPSGALIAVSTSRTSFAPSPAGIE